MSNVEQTQREKMLQRVLNLRAKAENDGSSEAEMQSAFAVAAKLMDLYNIEEAELALAEAEGRIVLDIVHKKSDTSALVGDKHRHKVILALAAIGEFTHTRSVYNRYSGNITFTGHRPDTELANYLIAVIKEAMEREYENYRRSNVAVGGGAKASFQMSMVNRISSRLYLMAQDAEAERQANKRKAEQLQIENAATSSSTALIVCEIAEQKRREVHDAYQTKYPNLRRMASFSYGANSTAHSAGHAAGERVNLGRAIGAGTKRMIA